MKINKVYIKNLNSLKGEHELDFTNAPLSEAGIFAITGKTGAGKSTILDAVSLAIYGKVPRFNKSISKTTVGESGALMTFGTRESVASVEYECNKGTFISKWSISLSRNNTIKDYEHEVADSKGNLLTVKKSEAEGKNEELIGLTFKQFTRSIMLAQGQFAELLKSKATERGELLEKITDSEIFREIGKRVYQKDSELNQELKSLNTALEKDMEGLIPSDQKEQKQKELTSLEESLLLLQKKKENVTKQIDIEHDLILIKKDIVSKKNVIEEKELGLKDFQAINGEKLANHELVLPFEGRIRNTRQLEDKIEEVKLEGSKLENQLENYTSKRTSLLSEIQPIIRKECADEQVTIQISIIEKGYNDVESEIKNASRNYNSTVPGFNKLIGKLSLNIDRSLDDSAVSNFQQAKEEALEVLELMKLKFNLKDPLKVKAEWESFEKLFRILSEARNAEDNQKRLSQELVGKKALLESHKAKLFLIPGKIAEVDSELKLMRVQKEKWEAKKESELLRAKVKDLRVKLSAGEPCPLCGSLDHPFAEHIPESKLLTIEKEIEHFVQGIEFQSNLKAEQVALQNSLSEKVKMLQGETEAVEKDLLNAGEIIDEIKPQLPKTLAAMSVREAMDEVDKSISGLKQFYAALEQEELWNEAAKLLGRLLELKSEIQSLRLKKANIYDGKTEFSSLVNNLRSSWTETITQIYSINISLKENSKKLEELSVERKIITEELQKDLAAKNIESLEAAKGLLLDAELYNREMQILNELKLSIETIRAAIETQENNLAGKRKLRNDQELEDLVQENEIIEEQVARILLRRDELREVLAYQKRLELSIKELKVKIKSLNKDNRKWLLLNEEIGDRQGNRFSKYAQFLTLQQLLKLANIRLDKLSGRYLLGMPENENQDDLIIIDRDMGMESRSVRTLSGGESFLVSLSLALALSDLASNKVDIGSLFIDEGFGTLDADTLEMVIATLEQLQIQSSKTIGVISHVDSLKDRLTTRIQLSQDAQGLSRIELIH